MGSTTRFAPAPTGRLHLGHLANALYVWGMARGRDGRVLLRLEDHDRQRCRPEFERDLLDDLDRLGLAPDEPATDAFRAGPTTYRQSDAGEAYAEALARLRDVAPVYACDCSRSTFSAWAAANGRSWSGPGCPGGCASRGLADGSGFALRVAIGGGTVRWRDELLGWRGGEVAAAGDPPVHDRLGNWTYGFCVVVDDARQGVGLVVRGEDLLDATATQIRLARVLGRTTPPRFAHHPLILRPDGSKLSKADGAASVGARLDAGTTPEVLFGEAAAAVGLISAARPLPLAEALELVRARDRASHPHPTLADGEVVLRPSTEADLDLLAGWFADPAIYGFWGGEPVPRGEVADKYIGRRCPDVESHVVLVAGEPAGYLQHHRAGPGDGGLDMVLLPEFRHRGLGPRAARRLVRFLRDELGWTDITVDPAVGNARAIRGWQNAGFVVEADWPDHEDGPALLMRYRGE